MRMELKLSKDIAINVSRNGKDIIDYSGFNGMRTRKKVIQILPGYDTKDNEPISYCPHGLTLEYMKESDREPETQRTVTREGWRYQKSN
jgi:hypothetical protein